MPTESKNAQGFSSLSFFSSSSSFPSERQVGFWKPDNMVVSEAGANSVISSLPEKRLPVESQMAKSLDRPESYLNGNQKVNLGMDMNTAGPGAAASHSFTLLRPVDQDPVHSSSYFADSKKNSMLGAQYENSLFSSSMSELFCRKLRLSSNNGLYGHSVDTVASHFEEEEPFESLEEIEAQTIGNLLPDDDDLLSGVIEGIDGVAQSNGDDMEELDFFSSVGGMDLGDDGFTAGRGSGFSAGNGQSLNAVAGEHPYGEHPSRTLFVRNINSSVEDSELKALFEQYGDIRTLYTACKHRGFVMISYYDIRAARSAMKALQDRPLRRRKLDIHYSIPKDNPSEKDINQGTISIIILDPSVSNDELLQIFNAYGEVKEIRESPQSSNYKLIEFYDIRATEAAYVALSGNDIAGNRFKVEPNRPGGAQRLMQHLRAELDPDQNGRLLHQNSPPANSSSGYPGSLPHFTGTPRSIDGNIMGINSAVRGPVSPLLESGFNHGISSSVPNGLQSLSRVGSIGNQPGLAKSIQLPGHLKFDIRGTSPLHPHSLPEYHDGFINPGSPGVMAANINPMQERIDSRQLHRVSSNGHSMELNENVFGSANGSRPIPGHHYAWSNSLHRQSPGMMWPNSPSQSFVNGIGSPHAPPHLHGLPRAPSHMLNTVLPINNHHVGSAPTVNPLWERRPSYAGESPEASGFHPGSLGSMRMANDSLHSMDFASSNIFPHVGGNGMDLPIPHKGVGLTSHQQRCMMFPGRGQMIPMMNSFDSPTERARSRRSEGSSNQADKKQFELDIDRIIRGDDTRTTLMIKNIPNKYTSKMLLAAIDERHKGTYDFIYLPIDFKNKCNVGYAFINMTDPKHIIPFYQTFNGKKWEKFNSEKVASLAYARIQGKSALIAHFQNSSLMNEDKRCRPILFNTEGPNAGDQVPFPMGVNVRSRPGRARASTQEEGNQDSPPSLADKENFVGENSSSVSVMGESE